MFKTILNAIKTPDVRKRLLYTLILIVIFRFGCYITVPGVDILALNEAMKKLNEREKSIIAMRFFEGKTQMEIASEIGISQAQVSRLEKGAIDHIKKDFIN